MGKERNDADIKRATVYSVDRLTRPTVLVWAQTEEMSLGVPGMLCLLDMSELSGPVESLFPLEYGPSSVGEESHDHCKKP